MAIVNRDRETDYRLYVYGNGTLEKNGYGQKKVHKFKTYQEVMDYLKFAWTKAGNFKHNRTKQYILVEYTAPYTSRIVKIFECKLGGE